MSGVFRPGIPGRLETDRNWASTDARTKVAVVWTGWTAYLQEARSDGRVSGGGGLGRLVPGGGRGVGGGENGVGGLTLIGEQTGGPYGDL